MRPRSLPKRSCARWRRAPRASPLVTGRRASRPTPSRALSMFLRRGPCLRIQPTDTSPPVALAPDVLRLPEFQYLAPRSLDEAADLLAEHGSSAMVVAGGTDLFPNMKRRQQEPSVVIGLRALADLRAVSAGDGLVRIGATATLHEVATHPLVR